VEEVGKIRLFPRAAMNAPDALIEIAGRLRIGDELADADRLLIADILDDVARRQSKPRSKVENRRDILRRVKNIYFVHLDATPAAREIAARWQQYIPTRIPQPPGPIEHYFERLHREGIRPLKYRKILDDLQATRR
jgi:hypothetical protein